MRRTFLIVLLAPSLLLPSNGLRAADESPAAQPAVDEPAARPPAKKVAGDGESAAPADAKPKPATTDRSRRDGSAGKADAVAKKAAKDEAASKADPLTPRPRNRDEALRYLENRTIGVDFKDETLANVARYLSALTGVNIVVGRPLLEDQNELKVTFRLRNVTAKTVLELVARQHRLGIGFSNGVLQITSEKEARGKPVLRLYMITDITQPIRDFPAPDLMLKPAGADFEPVEETVTESAFSDADDIITLVRDNTGGETWEDEGISSSTLRNHLVIRQYEEVHREIADLLQRLRAAR